MNMKKAVLVIFGKMVHLDDCVKVQRIDRQLYVDESKLDETCERLLEHFDSYLVPSKYENMIFFQSPAKKEDILPEFKDGDWMDIERYLSHYFNREDIHEHDILCRCVDNEEVSESYKKWAYKGKPKYLSAEEWVFSRLAELNTELFNEIEPIIAQEEA